MGGDQSLVMWFSAGNEWENPKLRNIFRKDQQNLGSVDVKTKKRGGLSLMHLPYD